MTGWIRMHSLVTNILAAACLFLEISHAAVSQQNNSNSLQLLREERRTGICQRKYIRNDLSNLETLRGCKVIEGSLQLALMLSESPEKWAHYSFPELREITGYLLIFEVYNLTSLQNLFPNLAVIRGQELIDTHALIINSANELQQIGLLSLTNIQRGSVWIVDNIQLCYADTVDWSLITNGTTSDEEIKNISSNKCPNWCSSKCPTSMKSDYDRYCWGESSSSCQKVFKSSCPSCDRNACTDSGVCCSDQCLGGCTGPSAQDCHVCKHVIHNGTCKEECPSELYEYLERRCVTRANCVNLVADADLSKGSNLILRGKLYEAHGKKRCVLECPKDTELAPNKTACVPCNGTCKKLCPGKLVDSVEHARELAGCTRIAGVLKISIRRSPSVTSRTIVEELKQSLGKIEEIDYYLVITHTYALYSLDFLENLKVIHGKLLDDDRYALVVRSNENLMELWNASRTIKIRNKESRVLFHYNPKLCPNKIWEFVSQSGIDQSRSDDKLDIGITNGDKISCNTRILTVEVKKKMENGVLIRYENFRRNLTYTSHLLNYEIHYKEAVNYPAENVSKFEDDDWTILEYPKITDADVRFQKEPLWEQSRLVSHLKSYTWYAFYVKTIVIPTENNNNSGAESNIVYFQTLPGVPSRPTAIKVVTRETNSATLVWSLPNFPNGKLEKFNIFLESVREDERLRDQRSYCVHGRITRKMHSSSSSTKSISTKNSEGPCACCPTTTAFSGGGKSSRAHNFESIIYHDSMINQIINHVFISPHTFSSSPDADIDNNSIRSKRSLILRQHSSEQEGVFPVEESSPDFLNQYNNIFAMEMKKVDEIKFEPDQQTYFYKLKNLTHFRTYKVGIQVCRESSTDMEPRNGMNTRRCSDVAIETFQTEALSAADIIDFKSIAVYVIENNKLQVTWDEPPNPNGVILAYMVKVQKMEGSKYIDYTTTSCVTKKAFQTSGKHYTLPDGYPPGNYSVRIQVASLANNSDWTKDIFVLIEGKDEDAMSTLWILITVVPFMLLVAMAYHYYNRVKIQRLDKFSSANPEYLSNDVIIPEEKEVPRDKLTVLNDKELGQGSFGTVLEGILENIIEGQPTVRCAVKTIFEDCLFEDKLLFLREAALMVRLDCRCQHVVKLLGVVSKAQPIYVVMELMANGDLRNYLRSRRPGTKYIGEPPPTLRQILRMAAEIADGMAYIHMHKLVHRDLAARNCMVGEDLCIRIGDFGMTKEMHQNDYYRKLSRELSPVRWMAPESIRDGIFTNKSDVWAFAVVLWEMATLAAQPYQGLDSHQVCEYVVSGGTMEKPENCPSILFELMTSCWQQHAPSRPSFIQILERLSITLDTSFCQASFFNSPEGLAYQHRLKSQSKDETTIELRFESLPLNTSNNDDNDDDFYDIDEKYEMQHHIIDDLGDVASTEPLLSSSPNGIIFNSRYDTNQQLVQFFQSSN